MWKTGRCGRLARTHLPIDRGWPNLEAALSLIWRWRGVLEGKWAEASRAGFSTWPSNRFSISHLLSVRPPIARLPNTRDAHAHLLSEALIGVANAASAAGLASAGGGCGGCGSALGSCRRPAAPLGPRPRPLASVRTKPLDRVHAAAAVAALRLIILRSSRGLWPPAFSLSRGWKRGRILADHASYSYLSPRHARAQQTNREQSHI